MWKAIEQGNVDVAKRLLELGAEPALTHDPRLNPADEDAHERLMDGDDQIIERHTSLMVATSRDDLNTMRFLLDNGVEANFFNPKCQMNMEHLVALMHFGLQRRQKQCGCYWSAVLIPTKHVH